MALLANDFLILEPHRSDSAGPIDYTLIGRVNSASDGGLMFTNTTGTGFRNTIPADITTTNVSTDNIELFTDGNAPNDVDYQNFVDYLKFYVNNNGREDLLNPSFSVIGITRVDNNQTNVCKQYYALGFSDESDYCQRNSPSVANNYADGTREGFPRTIFDDGDYTIGLTGTKIASSIVRVGKDGTAPTGPHPVVRKIDKDFSLYGDRKYVKITWAGTISPSFYIYVFGETNSAPMIGKILCNGAGGTATVVNASDSSPISFDKIYSVVALKNSTTITCWNDVVKTELINPSQDLTIQYQIVGESSWSTWTTIPTTHAFSLTFFDERVLMFDTSQRIFVTTNAYGLQQVQVCSTTHSSILHEGFGKFIPFSPDEDIAYVDFDSPDINLLGIEPGDKVVGVENGNYVDLGYVKEIDQSPNYPSLIVSLFGDTVTGYDGWIKVLSGRRSRFGVWVRREVACQPSPPDEFETNSIFRVYGRT